MSKLPGYLPLPTHASTDIPERYTDHPFRAIPSFGSSPDTVVILEELDGSSPPETPLNGYFLYKEERRSTKTAVRLMLASFLLLVFGLLLWKLVHCQSSDMSVDYEK